LDAGLLCRQLRDDVGLHGGNKIGDIGCRNVCEPTPPLLKKSSFGPLLAPHVPLTSKGEFMPTPLATT